MPVMLRFIDDIYAIVLVGGKDGISMQRWKEFKEDLCNFGILKWDVGNPSLSVNFLDLTVTIEDGTIRSKTYQKPTNLHQYICPNSAHPPWTIKSIISSMLSKYYRQNTDITDYWKIAIDFYKYLKDRG